MIYLYCIPYCLRIFHLNIRHTSAGEELQTLDASSPNTAIKQEGVLYRAMTYDISLDIRSEVPFRPFTACHGYYILNRIPTGMHGKVVHVNSCIYQK